MCPRCSSENCNCGFSSILERIKQAKPFVVVCSGCGKIRKFGKFVNMFVPMEKLMENYEVISVACDDCQAGLAGVKSL